MIKEVFKETMFCFTSDEEYKDFKEKHLPRHKEFTGWEILSSGKKVYIEDYEYKFRVTFKMLRIQ